MIKVKSAIARVSQGFQVPRHTLGDVEFHHKVMCLVSEAATGNRKTKRNIRAKFHQLRQFGFPVDNALERLGRQGYHIPNWLRASPKSEGISCIRSYVPVTRPQFTIDDNPTSR